MTRLPTIEVCVDTIDGAFAALQNGADRIELCTALEAGGLTPTPGAMEMCRGLKGKVYTMIRPRGGDFIYTPAELDQMKRDIEATRKAGLHGVVFGVTTATGAPDVKAMESLIAECEGLGVTLHRAFDVMPDPMEALETAIGLGFERILTSGGAFTALEGIERLTAVAAAAEGRIAIMPGAGVTAANVATFAGIPGVTDIHASCKAVQASAYGSDVPLMAKDAGYARNITDPATVRAFRAGVEAAWGQAKA